ncbi:hypothetical protein VTK26DRAFT_7316 [Humicola hyalothermophila]
MAATRKRRVVLRHRTAAPFRSQPESSSSSPPATTNGPGTPLLSTPLPRPPKSHEPRAATRSQASATTLSAAHSQNSPPRRSRNSVTVAWQETDRNNGRDPDAGEDAAEAGTSTTATADVGERAGSAVNVTHTTSPVPLSAHPSPAPSPAIDPVSQQIFMRKSTELTIPQRLTQMAGGLARASSDLARNAVPAGDPARDKSKRGGSFLSRLSMRGGRKKGFGDLDSDLELGNEARMDGANARVFSQPLASPLAGGFVPHHKEPPRYIRTKAVNKSTRDFNRMFLAQELVGTRPPEEGGGEMADGSKTPMVTVSVAGASDRKTTATGGAIWAAEFSKDGRYLATAGRDHVVRIWAVITTPEERRAHEEEEAASGAAGERLSAPVFRDQPVKEFRGHTGEVLDLSWSKNNFLLSSSMDKTVRLWHMSRPECLCTFKHKDFVTRLVFHPRDDRFFLAGSLDTILRLWSIPDKAVAFSAQLPDLVTAVAFSPDGKVAIAGLLNGLCMFYETEGLKLSTQIHVRSSRGKNAKGSKITGIQTMAIPPPSPIVAPLSRPGSSASMSQTSTNFASQGEVRVLVTSNDSRIRIYSLRDKTLEVKLKGHENSSSQIAATFSDDGKYVICGSEDRKAFIWSLTVGAALVQDKDKPPCESFEAHGEIVTTALFAPTKTRMLLGQSGDPIYDLCNPPPVVLQSLEEAASAAASQVALSTADGSQHPAPSEPISKRPEPSPAYIARSTHYDGNIIITTGDTGIVKVFRQDCAFAKRRHDTWETGSTFSRKLAAHGGGSGYVGGGLGRSFSVATRNSGGSTAHSRRGSLSQPFPPGITSSPQLGSGGGSVHSDRILSWRQGIENGGGDSKRAVLSNGGATPARSERSLSPVEARRLSLNSAAGGPGRGSSPGPGVGVTAANMSPASEARRQPYVGSSPARTQGHAGGSGSGAVASPTASVLGSPAASSAQKASARLVEQIGKGEEKEEEKGPSVPPTPSFTFRPADADDGTGGRSSTGSSTPKAQVGDVSTGGGTGSSSASLPFWNLSRWRGIAGFRAVSSPSQVSSAAATNGANGPAGRGAGGRRASVSNAKQSQNPGKSNDGSDDDRRPAPEADGERDGEDRGRRARRQSAGVLSGDNGTAVEGSEDTVGTRPDRRKSMPVGSLVEKQ